MVVLLSCLFPGQKGVDPMKKRFAALFCALALVLGFLSLSAWGAPTTIYLLAANDKMCDLPGNTLPVAVNGTIYIPYTVFDKDATGTDLGVYYGIKQDKGTILNLYSLNGNLTFTVNDSTCTDRDGNVMNFRAVIRNNIPYVPAQAVCSYFNLQYSFLVTPDRGTLIRICNSSASLSDLVFLSAASSAMLSRYNAVLQSMEPQPTPAVTATPSPTPTVTPTPSSPPGPTANPKEHVRVYVAIDASEAEGDLTLALPDGFQALFLFTPDSLPGQSALVRRALAGGHSVGLIPTGGTTEEALESLKRGNVLLSHIARTRTRIAAASGELAQALSAEGWRFWQSNVSGSTAATLLANLNTRRTEGRLTLPANSYTISQVTSQIRADGYHCRLPIETELG